MNLGLPTARARRVASAVLRSHNCLAALLALLGGLTSDALCHADESAGGAAFRSEVEPILAEFCLGCHSGAGAKANVSFDSFQSDRDLLESRELWWRALKQIRAGFMPPRDEPHPSADEFRRIEDWIKRSVFEIDPQDPDPGRVTVRRLNRNEYRNTIRDLMGIQYDAIAEFPPDDSGHGFDNIGEVLTISPLLLEKYITAAKSIVAQAVPTVARVVPERTLDGKSFRPADADKSKGPGKGELTLSFYKPASVSTVFAAPHASNYQLSVELSMGEKFVDGEFDLNKCELAFKADGQALFTQEFAWQGGKPIHFEFEQNWQAGDHELAFELKPLTPDEKQVRSLTMRILGVKIRGPLASEYWARPPRYERFFGNDVPDDLAARRNYARELLGRFATQAFRRPADPETVERLALLAESIFSQEGKSFETGIAAAMTAVLASPRFLFREETVDGLPAKTYPYVDEYSLASRLSYFFWSTMPDDELFRLAGEHKLRENLAAQVQRLLADERAHEFVRHFTGQWLQARDVDGVNINAFAVISADRQPDPEMERRRERFRELRRKATEDLTAEEKSELEEMRKAFFSAFGRVRQFELTGELRRAMRRETEMLFDHIVRGDRSLLELVDCGYTFLNERLAKHYGIEGVKGDEMRLVELPEGSVRGGVLTQGTVLAITSNPDRTSPVKRGLFILDNILGTPPPPPPPNVPPLEESAKPVGDRRPSLREALEVHRAEPLCNSCHNRMDPLGLAFENFNALGMFREKARDQEIDASGQLLSGEAFENVRQLKQIITGPRRRNFYRCLTEKLLTYALGRGLDYHDVDTVDAIVDRIERENGRASALLMGVIESAAFQKCRRPD